MQAVTECGESCDVRTQALGGLFANNALLCLTPQRYSLRAGLADRSSASTSADDALSNQIGLGSTSWCTSYSGMSTTIGMTTFMGSLLGGGGHRPPYRVSLESFVAPQRTSVIAFSRHCSVDAWPTL